MATHLNLNFLIKLVEATMVSFGPRNPFICKSLFEDKPVRIIEGPLSEVDSHLEAKNTWKRAKSPNYDRHVNKFYPYSELPYAGEYTLLKIPISVQNLIKHVDYWGEGRVVTPRGTSGFTDCYNINEKYKLVSRGADMDRKIPNRVPVDSLNECDTSGYIKDKSVELVTISGQPISSSCARDVARMVNDDVGVVVALGHDKQSADVETLEQTLNKEGLFYYPHHRVPSVLNEVTAFDTRLVYVGVEILKRELVTNVSAGRYGDAIKIIKELQVNRRDDPIRSAVTKMVKESHKNILLYAYHLWHNGGQEIVETYLPAQIFHVLNGDSVKVVYKKYNSPLTLGKSSDTGNGREVAGGAADAKEAWKFVPVWQDGDLSFKIQTASRKLYLRAGVRRNGERRAYAEPSSDDISYEWTLQPVAYKNKQLFYIISKEFKEGLKMNAGVGPAADRHAYTDVTPVCEPDEHGWDVVPLKDN